MTAEPLTGTPFPGRGASTTLSGPISGSYVALIEVRTETSLAIADSENVVFARRLSRQSRSGHYRFEPKAPPLSTFETHLTAMKIATKGVVPDDNIAMLLDRMAMLPVAVDEHTVRTGTGWNVDRFYISRGYISRHHRSPADSGTDRDPRAGKQRTTGQNQSSEPSAFHSCLLTPSSEMHGLCQCKSIENTQACRNGLVERNQHWWLRVTIHQ